MAVALSRTGPTASFNITIDVSDLIQRVQAGTMTSGAAQLAAAERAMAHFRDSVEGASHSDAYFAGVVARVQADVDRKKASRPTGSLL